MIIKYLTINTQVGGKINRPGKLAPIKFMPLKCRSDIIFSLNDCRRILNSCCLAGKITKCQKTLFLVFLAGGARQFGLDSLPPGGEDNQGGGARYPGISCPPRGQAVQGGKIYCYTGTHLR